MQAIRNNPKISIIIPAYNSQSYIGKTVECLLSQHYKNIEIIVVNDGSTDNTEKIVKSYGEQGVIIFSQENKGQDVAFNLGYNHCTGDYIKFMDSDDLVNPEMIEKQVATLNGSDEYVAYGEWARFYNDKPEPADFTKLDYWKDMSPLDFLTARPEGVMLQCGIMLMPRKLIDMAGLWDERLILFNDTEFFTRVLLASKGVRFSEGAKLYYRSGQINSISAGRTRKYYESTFLATNLIAKHLLAIEDSNRIRKLISNTFLMQYYHMYPKFPDLIKQHEEKISLYGYGTLEADGGRIFKRLSKILGWRSAKKIQLFFYELGYLNFLYKLKERIN